MTRPCRTWLGHDVVVRISGSAVATSAVLFASALFLVGPVETAGASRSPLTATATPRAPLPNEVFTIEGQGLTSGRLVRLQRRAPDRSWTTVASTRSKGSAGAFSFRYRASSQRVTLRFFAPSTPPPRHFDAVRSRPVAVTTTTMSSKLSIRQGLEPDGSARTTAVVTLLPFRQGRTVRIQRLGAEGWHTVAVARHNQYPSFPVTIKDPTAEPARYRIVADPYHGAARYVGASTTFGTGATAVPPGVS